MTYLFISKSPQQQTDYLILFVSELLGQVIPSIQETPDIHILDRREENSIGIEEVKDFVKEMIFKPFGVSKQVAIIYEAEKLTPQAQNSFLKTLEESSDDTIYILCVNNEKNVLPTIYSRSKPVYIKQGKLEMMEDAKPQILDQDLVEQFGYIDSISKEKVKCLELLNEIEEYFRQELEKEIKNDNINSSKATSEQLRYIQETRDKINSNCNKKLVLEALLLYLNT